MPEINDRDETKPLTYVANDWFYMKTGNNGECKIMDEKCEANKSAVDGLRDSTNYLGTWTTQYNDAKMLYNRELLFMVNIFVGLVMLCYYIYLNQSVLPSPAVAIKGLGDVGNKMGALANSGPSVTVAAK